MRFYTFFQSENLETRALLHPRRWAFTTPQMRLLTPPKRWDDTDRVQINQAASGLVKIVCLYLCWAHLLEESAVLDKCTVYLPSSCIFHRLHQFES